MPETLCIAELQDGRRALAYIDREHQTAQLVLVLRPDDLIPKSMRVQAPPPQFKMVPVPVVDIETGRIVGWVHDFQELPIPPRLPEPRITVDDLLNRGAQIAPSENLSPEDQILRDINHLRDDDSEAPAIP